MALTPDELIPVWGGALTPAPFLETPPDGDLPGGVVQTVEQACLLLYTPSQPNGHAMLIMAGGGYTALMAEREGSDVALWLAGLGYHAYVLIHRLPDARHGPSAPLDDALEAMRLIRSRPETQQGVGVIGLSSGGHLAACLVAPYPDEWTPPPTFHKGQATRPDRLIVGYAPISTNAKGRTIVPDKASLAPPEKQALYDRLQPDVQMSAEPPPAFLVYSNSDQVVPVENGFRLRDAIEAAGGSAELHVFANAPHGFALDTRDGPVALWPVLCEAWLAQTGFR